MKVNEVKLLWLTQVMKCSKYTVLNEGKKGQCLSRSHGEFKHPSGYTSNFAITVIQHMYPGYFLPTKDYGHLLQTQVLS